MLNLVFLLDITGSMGSQVEGVKQTVGKLTAAVFDQDYDVMLTIITFTEGPTGCYVTDDRFTDGAEAQTFISSLRLCVPPGSTGVSANGGDGDENTKAAVAQLLKLDNTMPTVAFLITDAGPHLTADRATDEATHEVNYLKQVHGIVDTDMFHILSLVHAHFETNLILNVVKYFKSSDHKLYSVIAKQMNGVLVTPQVDSSDRLAAGLFSILNQVFTRCVGGATAAAEDDAASNDLSDLDAFEFYDLSQVATVAREADVAQHALPPTGSTRDVLFEFVERATVVIGDKFAKRAVAASGLLEQVELLLLVAKCATGNLSIDAALERSAPLISKIREMLPEENQGHFKITAEDLPQVLQKAVATAGAGRSGPEGEAEHCNDALSIASVSAITLLTTEEAAVDALGGGDDEGMDPRTVLETAASLFMTHLAVLQLPVKNGRPDFMDAWSSVITQLSGDVVTAKDFLALIAADTATSGLSIRDRQYNYAQIMADPSDALASALLRVASGTQVLDVLTALLAGAPAGKFCPNMYRGTTAAALMGLLLPPPTRDEDGSAISEMSEFQQRVARKLVHSIRLIMGKPSAGLACEPESAPSKLVYQLLRIQSAEKLSGAGGKSAALRDVLEEVLSGQIQRMAKYNERGYLELVERVVQYDHPAEELEDAFLEHPLDRQLWVFDTQEAKLRALSSPLVAWFQVAARNLIFAVYGGEESGDDSKTSPAVVLDEIWPELGNVLPKLLLLQKRSARYTIEAGSTTASKPDWRRSEVLAQDLTSETYTSLAMQLLRKKHDTFLRQLRARRENMAAERRWQLALRTMRSPMDEFVEQLRTSVVSSASRDYKLLLRALKLSGAGELPESEYEAKVTVLVTGRRADTGEVVFNRGNLHADPTKFVPMSEAFQARLRAMQRDKQWPLAHTYRPSGTPNHSGHCTANPSAWAAKRSLRATTFWELP